ncbi:unnamed protein product [Psylliodes chrysocephalus]|uniref:Lipase domain-containing protein n=1 Tax=Psylliodes chrysocephalus TaxID=3402493 RepID=A0A9P0CEF5_9CUCU|nr:unnamed protein product [Psylliodes chrysocephala]
MSAMATTVAGLVLVSTVAAVMLIMSLVDGQLTTNSTATTLSGNQNNAQLIDPNGPSVQFVLFTRHKSPINLKIGNEELFKQSGFNTSNPTKIIIHGFTSSIKQDVFTIIRDGLDPARPGYRDNRLDNKLDPNDAILVEGLHTFIQVLGLAETVGHVDFYPNGGVVQPGCPDLQDLWKIGETLVCNHGRAYRLFAESIRDKNAFKSIKCKSIHEAALSKCTEDSDVYMGQPETYSDNGIYYFKTRSKPPYRL